MAKLKHQWDLVFPVLKREDVSQSWLKYDTEKTAPIRADNPQMHVPTGIVVRESPVRMKRAVLTIAQMFCEEMGYDHAGYSEKVDEPHCAYLFGTLPEMGVTDILGLTERRTDRVIVIGGCCFWEREDYWKLGWAWLHPYARHKGQFAKCWPYFKLRHSPIAVDPPWSIDMIKFLISQHYSFDDITTEMIKNKFVESVTGTPTKDHC